MTKFEIESVFAIMLMVVGMSILFAGKLAELSPEKRKELGAGLLEKMKRKFWFRKEQ